MAVDTDDLWQHYESSTRATVRISTEAYHRMVYSRVAIRLAYLVLTG